MYCSKLEAAVKGGRQFCGFKVDYAAAKLLPVVVVVVVVLLAGCWGCGVALVSIYSFPRFQSVSPFRKWIHRENNFPALPKCTCMLLNIMTLYITLLFLKCTCTLVNKITLFISLLSLKCTCI